MEGQEASASNSPCCVPSTKKKKTYCFEQQSPIVLVQRMQGSCIHRISLSVRCEIADNVHDFQQRHLRFCVPNLKHLREGEKTPILSHIK